MTTYTTTKGESRPDMTEVDALHLMITQNWLSGASHTIHVEQNPDLSVLLSQGTKACRLTQGFDAEAQGHVVVALDVDGEFDEVHYYGFPKYSGLETLTRAIESLTACRDALLKVRKA